MPQPQTPKLSQLPMNADYCQTQFTRTPATDQVSTQQASQPPTEADAGDMDVIGAAESQWLTYVASCARPARRHAGVTHPGVQPYDVPSQRASAATGAAANADLSDGDRSGGNPPATPSSHFPPHARGQVLLPLQATSVHRSLYRCTHI